MNLPSNKTYKDNIDPRREAKIVNSYEKGKMKLLAAFSAKGKSKFFKE